MITEISFLGELSFYNIFDNNIHSKANNFLSVYDLDQHITRERLTMWNSVLSKATINPSWDPVTYIPGNSCQANSYHSVEAYYQESSSKLFFRCFVSFKKISNKLLLQKVMFDVRRHSEFEAKYA